MLSNKERNVVLHPYQSFRCVPRICMAKRQIQKCKFSEILRSYFVFLPHPVGTKLAIHGELCKFPAKQHFLSDCNAFGQHFLSRHFFDRTLEVLKLVDKHKIITVAQKQLRQHTYHVSVTYLLTTIYKKHGIVHYGM